MMGRKTLLFVAVMLSGSAWGDMVPYNTYLASDWSDIHAKLDGKTGVEMAASAFFSQPCGYVTYEVGGGDVPRGTKLWVVANNDRQVVGEVDMTSLGSYNFAEFGATYGIYGDNPSTSGVDDGAANHEPLIVAALIGGQYYQGYFSSGVLAGGPPSGGYQFTDEENDILINRYYSVPPQPGDANHDGRVDYLDLGVLATNYNMGGQNWLTGDFNYDGTVDYLDLGILATNYNFGVPPGQGVPEPATLALLALGVPLFLRRRR